jgi:hypothetical protein
LPHRKRIGGPSLNGASETTGLDIRRKRAMFEKYVMACLMTCLGLLRFAIYERAALPTNGLTSGPKDFLKPVNFPSTNKNR